MSLAVKKIISHPTNLPRYHFIRRAKVLHSYVKVNIFASMIKYTLPPNKCSGRRIPNQASSWVEAQDPLLYRRRPNDVVRTQIHALRDSITAPPAIELHICRPYQRDSLQPG